MEFQILFLTSRLSMRMVFLCLSLMLILCGCHVSGRHFSKYFSDADMSNTSLVEAVLDIESFVCQSTCNEKFPQASVRDKNFRGSCAPCYCDALCARYQDCCPDVVLRQLVTYEEAEASCYSTYLAGPREGADNKETPMIDRCPGQVKLNSDKETQATIQKCEFPNVTVVDESVPVSFDLATYRNVHCARCHNVSDPDLWKAEIKCDGTSKKLFATAASKLEMFLILATRSGQERTSCGMRFLPKTHKRKCKFPEASLVSACNITGQVGTLHKNVARACAMPYVSAFKPSKQNYVYKNMFCCLCNLPRLPTLEGLERMIAEPDKAVVTRISFRALLDFDDAVAGKPEVQKNIAPRACAAAMVYDKLKCQCRPLTCSSGKVLTSQGKCEVMESSLSVLGYRVCASLAFQVPSPIPLSKVKLLAVLPTREFTTVKKVVMKVASWCPTTLSLALDFQVFLWNDNFTKSVEDAAAFRDKIVNRLRHSFSIKEVNFTLNPDCPPLEGVSFPCSLDTNMSVGSLTRFPLMNTKWREFEKHVYFIPYSEVTTCPSVELSNEDLEFYKTRSGMLNSTGNGSLSDLESLTSMGDSLIGMCVSDFISLTSVSGKFCQEEHTEDQDFDQTTDLGLLSVICTCISLLCLAIIFFVYLALPKVRTASGLNIMTLTLLLFIAQALYEFAIEQFEMPTLCSFFGGLIHFFWLAAIFSMNACTLERYFRLCFPLRSRSFFFMRNAFASATVYSLVCPLVVVGLNISGSLYFLDDVGYGSGRLCYINNSTARIYSFALPMAILIIVNVVLFFLMVWNLRRRSKRVLETSRSFDLKIGLVACVRLSSVTGVTWFVAFLYEVVHDRVLDYLFTAFMGLQGVLFFFSLILHRRVLHQLMPGWVAPPTSTSSFKSTGNTPAQSPTYDAPLQERKRILSN